MLSASRESIVLASSRTSIVLALVGTLGCAPSAPDDACDVCPVEIQRIVTLGSAGGEGALLSTAWSVARDSQLRYFVTTPFMSEELPYVYDQRGRFLQRLGSIGDGPGEFRRAQVALVAPGDTLFIFDQASRLSVFSPGLEYIRSAPAIPAPYDAVALPSGTIVTDLALPTGAPLHQYDRDGNLLRSFGEVQRRWGGFSRSPAYVLAASRMGGLWAISRHFRYTIQLWDSVGLKVREFAPTVDWFPPSDSLWNPTPDKPPMSQVVGAWEDGEGRVWTVAQVGAPEWRRGLGRPRRTEGRTHYSVERVGDVFDALVEVRDGDSGALVTSRRFPELGDPRVIEPFLIADTYADTDGWQYIRVWRVRTPADTVRTD